MPSKKTLLIDYLMIPLTGYQKQECGLVNESHDDKLGACRLYCAAFVDVGGTHGVTKLSTGG